MIAVLFGVSSASYHLMLSLDKAAVLFCVLSTLNLRSYASMSKLVLWHLVLNSCNYRQEGK